MKKVKKEILIKEIRSIFRDFSTIIVVHLEKSNASESSELRSSLWDKAADLKIVKNSLLRIVLLEYSFLEVVNNLDKESAVLYSNDVISLSKSLCTFMKGNDRVNIINMIHEGLVFCQERVKNVASLPSLADVQLQIVAILGCAVVNKLRRLLNDSKQQIFSVVEACANG